MFLEAAPGFKDKLNPEVIPNPIFPHCCLPQDTFLKLFVPKPPLGLIFRFSRQNFLFSFEFLHFRAKIDIWVDFFSFSCTLLKSSNPMSFKESILLFEYTTPGQILFMGRHIASSYTFWLHIIRGTVASSYNF